MPRQVGVSRSFRENFYLISDAATGTGIVILHIVTTYFHQSHELRSILVAGLQLIIDTNNGPFQSLDIRIKSFLCRKINRFQVYKKSLQLERTIAVRTNIITFFHITVFFKIKT